jgi:hypothetical protein
LLGELAAPSAPAQSASVALAEAYVIENKRLIKIGFVS